MTISAWAAPAKHEAFEKFDYDPGTLADDEVHIAVEACGICHSDLSMWKNDWGNAKYPLVPGHEIVGVIEQIGSRVNNLQVGQRVGVGWQSSSCGQCDPCNSGTQQMCGKSERTIVKRHGGFADAVRVNANFAFPIPDDLDASIVGPLLCGGITVFDPLYSLNIKPTSRVGVVGIGGLGHLAIKFAKAWGCEVTAFTSTEQKQAEAIDMGAHRAVDSTSAEEIAKLSGQLDLIIVTVNVGLDWNAYMGTLARKGRLHFVGLVLEPWQFPPASVLGQAKNVSGSPIGSPTAIRAMLDFAARHKIEPIVETFPFDQVNEAMAHLEAGKARYRIVLQR